MTNEEFAYNQTLLLITVVAYGVPACGGTDPEHLGFVHCFLLGSKQWSSSVKSKVWTLIHPPKYPHFSSISPSAVTKSWQRCIICDHVAPFKTSIRVSSKFPHSIGVIIFNTAANTSTKHKHFWSHPNCTWEGTCRRWNVAVRHHILLPFLCIKIVYPDNWIRFRYILTWTTPTKHKDQMIHVNCHMIISLQHAVYFFCSDKAMVSMFSASKLLLMLI